MSKTLSCSELTGERIATLSGNPTNRVIGGKELHFALMTLSVPRADAPIVL